MSPRDGDKRLIGFGNLDLGAQFVERQPAYEIVRYVGTAFEPECILAGAGDQEIEQDLALRRQQRTGFGFAGSQDVEIGGQDVLQKMLGIRT